MHPNRLAIRAHCASGLIKPLVVPINFLNFHMCTEYIYQLSLNK